MTRIEAGPAPKPGSRIVVRGLPVRPDFMASHVGAQRRTSTGSRSSLSVSSLPGGVIGS